MKRAKPTEHNHTIGSEFLFPTKTYPGFLHLRSKKGRMRGELICKNREP